MPRLDPSGLASACPACAPLVKELSAEQVPRIRLLLEPKLRGKTRRKGVCSVFLPDIDAQAVVSHREVQSLCSIDDGQIAYASFDGGSNYMLIGCWNEGYGPVRPGVQIDSTLAAPDPLIAVNDKQIAQAAEQCLERVSMIADTKTRLNGLPACRSRCCTS